MTHGKAWRPIQYLGNKLRVLDAVRDACVLGLNPEDRVWDAFSGSSVVAQSLAASGHRVYATDALSMSTVLARSLLGVDRRDDRSLAPIGDEVITRANILHVAIWSDAIGAERSAIAAKDSMLLTQLGLSLPQRWRRDNATAEQLEGFGRVEHAADRCSPSPNDLLASTYAGTYFGIGQAVRLDALRAAIAELKNEDVIDDWQHSCMLTALMSAASRCVHSAGKHFAQPLKLSTSSFHRRRLLSDRALSVDKAFATALFEIDQAARPPGEGHIVEQTEAEQIDSSQLRDLQIRSVYADPPYTAQQYSRFYHILEVLVSGVPARLQQRGSTVTTGLYPTERHRSRFCSRVQAPSAFTELAEQARDADARLVVSYSVSDSASTGNVRSIEFDALVDLLRKVYGQGEVQTQQLGIKYRQFNSGGRSLPTRNDPEVLIIAGKI